MVTGNTEAQQALLAQEIENAFEVLQAGVSGRMYKWIRFLYDRSTRVKVDGHLSDSVKMREGVPQGGVVSHTGTYRHTWKQEAAAKIQT